jgi:tetratricopeptide (TPR) repeat protein
VDVNNTDNKVVMTIDNKEIGAKEMVTNYTFDIPSEDSGKQGTVMITIFNNAANNISIGYHIENDVSPLIKLYIPALGLAFIVVQFAAISIMFPIREMYASSSIYSKKYVAKADSGEYSVNEIKKTEKEKEEDMMLDEVLEIQLPPPMPATAAEQVCIPEPEMARARGKVDDGLIDEPDVKCSGCGEMNSAHAAMCFSCGTPLVAMEQLAIDPAEYLRKGESFAKAGRYEDALTCYDETLKHDAANELALLRKGEALHKLGKWGSAVQYVNTALKVNPNNIDTLILKAKILDERDRMDKSIEIYSQILALDPDNAFAKSKMEKVSQKFVEAAEEAELESAEDVLEQFMCVPGIGLARATALYDSGITSMDMLKNTSEEKLAGVKGISKGIAKKIRKALDAL